MAPRRDDPSMDFIGSHNSSRQGMRSRRIFDRLRLAAAILTASVVVALGVVGFAGTLKPVVGGTPGRGGQLHAWFDRDNGSLGMAGFKPADRSAFGWVNVPRDGTAEAGVRGPSQSRFNPRRGPSGSPRSRP